MSNPDSLRFKDFKYQSFREALDSVLPFECDQESLRGIIAGFLAPYSDLEMIALDTDSLTTEEGEELERWEKREYYPREMRVDLSSATFHDVVQITFHTSVRGQEFTSAAKFHQEADGGPPSLWFFIKE